MTKPLTIVTSNFQDNGGGAHAKWVRYHARMRALEADVLLRQELKGCALSGPGSELWYASEEALGMRGFLGPGAATALYINPKTVRPTRDWEDEVVGLGSVWALPPKVMSLDLAGTGVPIISGSVHLSYNSATRRKMEAEWLTRMPDKWRRIHDEETQLPVMIGGDFNSDPLPGARCEPERPTTPAGIKDRPHRTHRTVRNGPDGSRVLDDEADEILHSAGVHDAARHLANSGRTSGMAPTIRASPTHGPARRCDRMYLSAALLPAVLDVEIIPEPDSDHDTVLMRLDRGVVSDILARWPAAHRAAGRPARAPS